ncbi:ribonuclease HI [Vibrio parahaemolyticus]|nr:ribonuclease HI [Vibrio parahaemolyticus]
MTIKKEIPTTAINYAYTDGACITQTRLGGWGYVLSRDDQKKEGSGSNLQTTGNRMALTAAIKALEELQRRYPKNPIVVRSASQHVVKGISEWIISWKRNGWRNASKKPVENADLWQQLDTLNEALNVTWEWVKGHSGDPLIKKADSLARAAIPKHQ